MKANELRTLFNNKFGMGIWPDKYDIDFETYGHVCDLIIKSDINIIEIDGQSYALIAIGPSKGIMFKNVELIVKNQL